MPARDQTTEGFKHQFFALIDEIEDPITKNKISTIDPDISLMARSQPPHSAPLVKLREMKADRRVDGDKAANLITSLEAIDHLLQRSVGQPIAVIGEKDVLVRDQMPDGQKSLPDVTPGSRVY